MEENSSRETRNLKDFVHEAPCEGVIVALQPVLSVSDENIQSDKDKINDTCLNRQNQLDQAIVAKTFLNIGSFLR